MGLSIVRGQIRVQNKPDVTRIKGYINLKTKEKLVPGRGPELEEFPQEFRGVIF